MKSFSVQVVPSILSADFGKLALEAKKAEECGADALHIDIMDGHFVSNLSLGPKSVAAMNRATNLFLDVHLMMYNPYDYVERFIQAGADRITFHFEATENVEETLQFIRKCGVEAGLAFCPETSSSMIVKFLDKCDLLLLMTVNPGHSGQKFMPEMLEKIQFARNICNQMKLCKGGRFLSELQQEKAPVFPFAIQVDGGINHKTALQCIEAGANVLVSGSYIYSAKDMTQAIASLKTLK
ncbi:MAG: ribulose-phosphate 3-epimerase [Chlamydiales bacterium]|jgi:ribulose-phosphate 3-epimerase|nr:ribulose-phosphate 3-epimerase [Chlamydiales bacterium]